MVNANSIFGGMLTTLGAAKKTNCDALGVPWEPRYMLIGDANGTDPVPSPAQTQLVHQVYRAQINQLYVSPTDANVLIAELVLPPDVGGWWIRELALEDKDGVFCAVANAAPSYKPLLTQGSGRNQVVRMHIITSGTANIQLKIDPSVVLATRQYVDSSINGLLPADKAAGTYTKVVVNDRGVFLSGSSPNTLAGMGITDTFTKVEVESIVAQASALPVGTMVAFPVNKVAPGFLEIDGSVKSIAAYPDLAAFLGTAFNLGNEGAGNFRLPESRGEFLRGWDHGRGVDAGRAIGSLQGDSLKNHFHYLPTESGGGQAFDPMGLNPNMVLKDTVADWVLRTAGDNNGTAVPSGTPRTYSQSAESETRGRNLAVMWCIKAWNAPINQGNIDIAALASTVDRLGKNGPIAGSVRGLRASVAAASAVTTFAADWVVVEDAGGTSYRLKNFSQPINLASAAKGLGAMDVGAAPVNGYVSVYALFNPDTGLQGAIAVDTTAIVAPNLCAGVLPAGYTASALISVWRVAGSLFVAGYQEDRRYSSAFVGLLDINSDTATLAPVSIAGFVPKNAKTLSGQLVASNNSASGTSVAMDIAATASGIGGRFFNAFVLATGTAQTPFSDMPIVESQMMYTIRTIGTGPGRYSVLGSGYTF